MCFIIDEQDDMVMGTLTVRENIAFSANLRLSSKYTKEEKMKKVDQVIQELGLQSCADTPVGIVCNVCSFYM